MFLGQSSTAGSNWMFIAFEKAEEVLVSSDDATTLKVLLCVVKKHVVCYPPHRALSTFTYG